MRHRLRKLLARLIRLTDPPEPDQRTIIKVLDNALVRVAALADARDDAERQEYIRKVNELAEARQMAGTGPWTISPEAMAETDRIISEAYSRFGKPDAGNSTAIELREASAQGLYGNLELDLQNVGWRREVNLSWMQFSRWGIQQIILICRLYFIKHPWIRRGINLSAAYVFGQGVELSSPDADANDVLKRFRKRNRAVLGQIGLTEQEKRKSYDGNLFWVLFPDTQDKGETNVRLIDATEIQEIITDPDDADTPLLYRRVWSTRTFDIATGQYKQKSGTQWYPDFRYHPTDDKKPDQINNHPVSWETPIKHRKVGQVASWTFGCPRVYPAIDYSTEGRRHLAAAASVTQAMSQIALTFTTKGGQAAIEGAKQQFGTTVNPSTNVWDENPPSTANIFASGPGTKMEAFKTRGMGVDPSEVKEYRNMVACCLDIPPTWLADMETSNLSTAETLDRPTELGFQSRQEEWEEDLVDMGIFALQVSKGAPSGRLFESLNRRKMTNVEIVEADRKPNAKGKLVYEAAKIPKPNTIEVLCTFPAIREGDIPALVKATVQALALDRNGAEHGIDAKAAVRRMYTLLDIDDSDELVEATYPEATYDPDRTGNPPPPAVPPIVGTTPEKPVEAARIREAVKRVEKALENRENGRAAHTH